VCHDNVARSGGSGDPALSLRLAYAGRARALHTPEHGNRAAEQRDEQKIPERKI